MGRTCVWLFCVCILILPGCNEKTEPSGAAAYQQPGAAAVPGVGRRHLDISVGLSGLVSVNDGVGRVITNRLNVGVIPVDVDEWDESFMDILAGAGMVPDLLRVDVRARYFSRWIEAGIIRSLPADTLRRYGTLRTLTEAGGEARAVERVYGEGFWFIPVNDPAPYLLADSGRIYYRKDWLEEQGLAEPETVEEFKAMLAVFHKEYKTGVSGVSGLSLAGGVTYLVTLFGTDPESWVYEDEAWVPAFYSRRMVEGLAYARELYAGGLLQKDYAVTKANAAIHLFADGGAGSLIRHGDAFWLNRVLTAYGSRNGLTAVHSYIDHIGVMPPPAVTVQNGADEPETRRFWPRSVETEGCVVSASVNNEKLERILSLLEYTLSDEGRELAYFGIRGETGAMGADGVMKLLIDPETGRPFDIPRKYPGASLLFILDRSRSRLGENSPVIPSEMPPLIKAACYDAAAQYNPYAVDEGDGFCIRFLYTPAKAEMEAQINASAAFNAIVAGAAPVADMFEAFRAECEAKNIRAAIEEVTARMKDITR